MSQIPSLISDLAVILISAGLVTLLFKWLKQPVVLGYIVAGILAGPSITQIPTVRNPYRYRRRKYPYLGGYRRNLPLIRFRTRL